MLFPLCRVWYLEKVKFEKKSLRVICTVNYGNKLTAVSVDMSCDTSCVSVSEGGE